MSGVSVPYEPVGGMRRDQLLLSVCRSTVSVPYEPVGGMRLIPVLVVEQGLVREFQSPMSLWGV